MSGTRTARRYRQFPIATFDPMLRRFPKVIEGALELMPSGPPWDRDEYEEWLEYFDKACRLYYRVPALRPTVIRAYGEDTQSADLIDALEEHSIYSRGDLERALTASQPHPPLTGPGDPE